MRSNASQASPDVGETTASGTRDPRHDSDSTRAPTRADVPTEAAGPTSTTKIRRLIADERYFGLNALVLHAGATRVQARLAAQAPQQARLDIRSLGQDFGLDRAATSMLVNSLVVGGLLEPDGTGAYRTTPLFHEYAAAPVVKPLTRARARTLIARANELAARINADWTRNPYQIQSVAASGSYMSRRDPLPELSLWLILRKRPKVGGRRWRAPLTKAAGLRQIAAAMKGLSSFVIVHFAPDNQALPRPFSLVFEAGDGEVDLSPAWKRLRDWTVSIRRRGVQPKR